MRIAIELDGRGSGIADLVVALRKDAGLTQKALAERLETKQPVVSRWEAGHDEPRLTTLHRIADACGHRVVVSIESTGNDEVDRAQLRQQLAMTPEERLASVLNLSRTLVGARRIET
ncbi:MAG: helix-turn-helix transcriptional regulator [Acidimicrobiales bacterium]|nr:helix-turn-helix transcriptional regulator [Acidimicrobiales bacterium]